MENKVKLSLKFTALLIIGGFAFLTIPSIFAEEYDVGPYLPVREDIGTEWKFPTNTSVYDEMKKIWWIGNTDFEEWQLPSQYIWQGHMKGSGFAPNFLDLYIYGFDSSKNAIDLYNKHIEYWKNRGGYQEWSPNSISNADECYGRITTGSTTDKVALYCVKDSIVIFVLSAGFEFEMKDEVTKFANAVITKIDSDKIFKATDELNIDTTQQEKTIEQTSIEKPKSINEQQKTLFSFVDPTKDPQYYIDRYNNESIYKEWFDRNFSGYTIEEAVGLGSESETIPIPQNNTIPQWVKGIFAFYADDKIDDEELIEAIQFLIKEGIIKV